MIAELQGRLDAVAVSGTKTWFENYLKHVISCRGVKTPVVTRIVAEWRSEHGIERLPDENQLAVAQSLIAQSLAEDKFAGILYIHEVPGAEARARPAPDGGRRTFRGWRYLQLVDKPLVQCTRAGSADPPRRARDGRMDRRMAHRR